MNMHKPLVKHRPAARGSNGTKETYFTHVAREGLLLFGEKKNPKYHQTKMYECYQSIAEVDVYSTLFYSYLPAIDLQVPKRRTQETPKSLQSKEL